MFVTLGTHMAGAGYHWLAWSLLALQFLVYPQLMYLWARRAADPRRAEIRNMVIDAGLFGVWAAVLAFPVWITFILFIGVTFNLTVFASRKGFVRALVAMSAGALLYVAIAGLRVSPETDLPTTLLSIAGVSIYMLLIAESGYTRSIKLYEARERLRISERLQHQKLDEITALQALLLEQANRDPLTGLYNRRFFEPTLERELARCHREKQPLSLILIDLDHFKQVNDTYGHQIGDTVLKALAAMLSAQARASDVVCRYGGEEFLLLLPNMACNVALERAEHWRTSFAEMVMYSGVTPVRVTLSVGIVSYPEHGASSEDLIRYADVSLYRAKMLGRNQCVVFDA